MSFDQGVDPTSLLRRGEGEETAIRCNFQRLQMIVFNGEQWLHKRKESKQAPLLPPHLPDGFGTPCPGDCWIESECIIQSKF